MLWSKLVVCSTIRGGHRRKIWWLIMVRNGYGGTFFILTTANVGQQWLRLCWKLVDMNHLERSVHVQKKHKYIQVSHSISTPVNHASFKRSLFTGFNASIMIELFNISDYPLLTSINQLLVIFTSSSDYPLVVLDPIFQGGVLNMDPSSFRIFTGSYPISW